MSLLNAIAGKNSQRRRAALLRYAQILETGDSSDADELLELGAMLGKTEADMTEDTRIICGWNRCQEIYDLGTANAKQYGDAKKAADEFRKETAAFLDGREAKQIQLDGDEMHLEMTVRGAYRQVDHMREMKKKNADLLAGKVLPAD